MFRGIAFFPTYNLEQRPPVRILVTGGSGRLGSQIKRQFPDVYAPTRKELDFTNQDQVEEVIRKFKPHFVIHCGAYTDVMKAEKERDICWKTNVDGTRNLIEICKLLEHVHFTFVSTACVFSGKEGNYVESDIPYPSNFYGLTKTVAESLVRYSNLNWLIVRTNFVKRGPWPHERAFKDRFGSYMYADEVATQILKLIYLNAKGIIHVCGKKKLSMLELAKQYSPNVKPLTLKRFYNTNPEAPHLTQDMSLRSYYKKLC